MTHLMQTQPYQPGTTRRAGKPWSRGSGPSFMPVARKAPARSRSSREKIQLAPGTDVCVRCRSSSNPATRTSDVADAAPAWSSSVLIGTPDHRAALISPKFAGSELPEHSITCVPAGVERAARSAGVRSNGLGPLTRMRDEPRAAWAADAAVRTKN